ncbi:accessory Sec system protein translocase subunit SecY2 [Ligilactobacillus equi]|uniref:accessory Sec system protein translocase subunit SecY2 n=1 Tax=Ligilactobacillus equi TaxID=137357 RepID=UPI002ED23413
MNKLLSKNPLLRKGLWTLLILLVFMIGRQIPLPFAANVISKTDKQNFLAIVGATTGGNFNQSTLFSLGLGPWMSAMIIISLLAMNKRLGFTNLPQNKQQNWQMALTMIIGIVQALVIALGANLTERTPRAFILTTLFLVAGGFFLIWMASINTEKGIGGASTIILTNMLISFIGSFKPIYQVISKSSNATLWFSLCAVGGILIVMLAIIFERSEYRISLNRIMVTNSYGDKIYLPIKLTPSGAMPIMFGISLMVIPQYIFLLLATLLPQVPGLTWLVNNLTITKPLGVAMYIAILFGLSLGFSYINLDPETTAENLQKAGDYIDNVAIGQPTEDYIRYYLKRISLVGATYMTILAGCPMIVGVFYPDYSQSMMLVGNIMLTVTFVLTLIDQVRTINLRSHYRDVLG